MSNIFYGTTSHCLKITEKVAFNIASEASYGYIFEVWKKAINGHFFENLKFKVK